MRELVFSLTKKDFKLEWFSGTGPGGQNRNKVQACCRITHIETGITAQSSRHRERLKNLHDAFHTLAERLRPWLEAKALGDRPVYNPTTDTIRTYHLADNRVKDMESGFEQSWSEVRKDLSPMMEARRISVLTKTDTSDS